MKQMTSPQKQSGFGMIEVMIVVAIFVLIAAAVIGVGRNLTDQSEVTTVAMEHQSLVNGVRNMYRLDNSYAGIDAATVLTNGQAVPDTMRSADNTTIRHKWSIDEDDVDIDPVNGGQSFSVTYNEIPPEFCLGFVSSVFRDALISNIDGTDIESTDEAEPLCRAAVDGDVNAVVTFTYN